MKFMLKFLWPKGSNLENNRPASNNTPKCPQCKAPSTFLVASADRNRHATAEIFDYFQCSACGLVFMDPIPSDLSPYYAGGYHTIPSSVEELKQTVAAQPGRLETVLQFKQGGRLLEIGPWIGAFSYRASRAGFDVSAIEMDQDCVDFLNSKVGIRAIQSADPATAMEALGEHFDVIVLWHCLEHLRDPWKVIQQAAEHLSPDGILLIATPNIESYEFSVLRAAWFSLDAPRHLYFFPIASLTALCSRLGLERRFFTTRDEVSQELGSTSWRHAATSIVPIRFVRGVLALIFKLVAKRKQRGKELGSSYTAVFQRPSGQSSR